MPKKTKKRLSDAEFKGHTMALEETLMQVVEERLPHCGMQVAVVSLMAVTSSVLRAAVTMHPEARASLLDGVAGMREDLLTPVPLCPDCGRPMTPEHETTH